MSNIYYHETELVAEEKGEAGKTVYVYDKNGNEVRSATEAGAVTEKV